MQTWTIDGKPGSAAVPASTVAHLLEAPAAAEPGAQLLAFLNAVVPVDYLSVVRYVPSSRAGLTAPELVEGHADPALSNVTPACFAVYRERFWRQDEATRLAQNVGREAGPLTALRFAPADIRLASWRRDIYEHAHLDDRLTFLYAPLEGAAFALNLYRGRRHGPFAGGEIERLLTVAPLVKQAHRAVLGTRIDAPDIDARVERAAAALARRLPELSERERAVCARIACGISADGIAADLDVAPSTVTTLRKRAYAKLARRGLTVGRFALHQLAQ